MTPRAPLAAARAARSATAAPLLDPADSAAAGWLGPLRARLTADTPNSAEARTCQQPDSAESHTCQRPDSAEARDRIAAADSAGWLAAAEAGAHEAHDAVAPDARDTADSAESNARDTADSAESDARRTPQPLTIDPMLAAALLRADVVGPARVWLLARALDGAGRGWLPLATLRAALTARDSVWRIGGARRLRQLLAAGDDLFWQRDAHGRLWLRGAVRLAAALNVERLSGAAVALDRQALLDGHAATRAALYAACHAARPPDRPIARATLHTLTGVPARTQRHYDVATGITRTAHYALCAPHSAADAQAHAWRHGGAACTFTDHRGQHGPAGRVWLARRLPNSYRRPAAPPSQAPAGRHRQRQRRHNRQLRHLLATCGTRGTGRPLPAYERRYFDAARAAARAVGRSAAVYWRSSGGGGNNRQVWYAW